MLATPVSWFALTGLLAAILAAVGVWLSVGTFARTEDVRGRLYPDTGVVMMNGRAAGTVLDVSVRDGEAVALGAPLVTVRTEQGMSGTGATAEEEAIAALDQQIALSLRQLTLSGESLSAELARVDAESVGARAELEALNRQNVEAETLRQMAGKEVNEVRGLAADGVMSRRDLQRREETLARSGQAVAALMQQRAQVAAQIAKLDRQRTAMEAAQRMEAGRIELSMASLRQQRAEIAGRRQYVLAAPLAGRVTAMAARVGDAVDPARTLMAIVPEGGLLQAELQVPSKAIGFVEAGQEVRLRIDAFPFERFGTISARVAEVAAVPTGHDADAGFRVVAALAATSIDAYGQSHKLQPGMTLGATIVTDRRPLIDWLLAPLLAYTRR